MNKAREQSLGTGAAKPPCPGSQDRPGRATYFVEILPFHGHGGGLWHYGVTFRRIGKHVVVYDGDKTYVYIASLVKITDCAGREVPTRGP